jgi:hypothetical protein
MKNDKEANDLKFNFDEVLSIFNPCDVIYFAKRIANIDFKSIHIQKRSMPQQIEIGLGDSNSIILQYCILRTILIIKFWLGTQ